MTIDGELLKIMKQIKKAIFLKHDKVVIWLNGQNHVIEVEKFAEGTVRGVRVGEYLFLQQNRAARSMWAMLARRGVSLIWIIRNKGYVGKIQDTTVFWKIRGEFVAVGRIL